MKAPRKPVTPRKTPAHVAKIRELQRIRRVTEAGDAGVNPDGVLVDRRQDPTAIPVQKNARLGVPAPNAVPIHVKGAGLFLWAGGIAINDLGEVWECGRNTDGCQYGSHVINKADTTQRKRRLIADAAIALWEEFAK